MSQSRILGVCVNKLQPACAYISSSRAHVSGATPIGNVNEPLDSFAIPIRRFQIFGRSKSTATTLAPSAISTRNGPIAEPAPSRTKYRSDISRYPGLSTHFTMASPALGSIVPYSTQRRTCALRRSPARVSPLYGTRSSFAPRFGPVPWTKPVKSLSGPGGAAMAASKEAAEPSGAMNSKSSYALARPAAAMARAASGDWHCSSTRALRWRT
mmetsp:Transcript_11500/g.30335  ORF Transcript_11500/g.30335 Transcript_11500/m.30335 type:complete len:212 (+) Transcript_11500:930-1565(+)